MASIPLTAGRHGREEWGAPLTPEQRQPLREAMYAAFTELPMGVFHRFDNFAAHVCFGPHNPLLLGRRRDQVRVHVAGRILLPRDELLYETGRHVLGQLASNRLVSLGCLQAGHDADGELLIAPAAPGRVLRPRTEWDRRLAGLVWWDRRLAGRGSAAGFQRHCHRHRCGAAGGVAALL